MSSSALLSTLGLSLVLASAPRASPPPGPGVHFIAVGQGAAALVLGEGVSALIDAGPASGAEALAHALAVHGVERLDLVVATHFDADHIGGLGPLVAGLDGRLGSDDDVEIGRAWDRGLAAPLPPTDALAIYLGLVEDRRLAPEPTARFEGPGLSVELLDVPIEVDAAENDRGLLLCVEVAGLRVLVPGDASAARVEAAAELCGPVDLLWASHHGSAGASSIAALERADPRLTIVSAGPANSHCHPAPATLAHLHARELLILDGAGLWPSESCPAIAAALGPGHRFVGHDVWVDGQLGAWAHSAALWVEL